MNICRVYAKQVGPGGRTVCKILGASSVPAASTTTTTSPGTKRMEKSEKFWVVRKGATPAFPGEKGFVGGSMGEQSVILEGVENKDAR